MSGRERWLRHLALALVILATAAFSGARAVLFAQAVTVPILALLLGMGEPLWQRIRMIAVVGLTAFAGLAGGIVLDQRSGCGFADRLIATGLTLTRLDDADALARERYSKRLAADGAAEIPDVVQRDAPAERTQRKAPGEKSKKSAEVDRDDGLVGSVYIRPVLWADALERIGEAPLLGHGILNEPDLVIGDFPHYHEQYLSWLVWGGPLMLVSGLLMLFAPLMVFGVRKSRDGAVLALAMIGPVAVSFLAGSYLLHTVMVLGYVTTLALLYALARERAPFGWRMPRSDAVDASGEMAAQ
jgi:hypothetical protein